MKKVLALFLSLAILLSLSISAASAAEIIPLFEENADERIAANFSADEMITAQLNLIYRGEDYAERNAAIFEQIREVIPEAQWDPARWSDRKFMDVTLPAGDYTKLREFKDILSAVVYIPDPIPVNEDGTVDIEVTYGCTMSAVQQVQYDAADWSGKFAILEGCYALSKTDLLEAIGTICRYEFVRDTSINKIYLRIPATAEEEIKDLALVKKCVYCSLPASKLNNDAQKLIAEADPAEIVRVNISTDRGDIVPIREYLNMSKQEINRYLDIVDENGVSEYTKIAYAYHSGFNRALLAEIEEKTGAVYAARPYTLSGEGEIDVEILTYADILAYFSVDIAVGKLEELSRIDGIMTISYSFPKEPDPNDYWIDLGGDQDLARKLFGEPNENGWYYAPPGSNSWAFGVQDEEEYKRFKEIEYVKGVIYCRPAPSDGWWKLEGDPEFLKATYGEPNADGRYYVPKKDAVKGDVDYDYDLTILDATGIQRELAGLRAAHFNAEVADYDNDGDITVVDATRIQRTLANVG